MKTNEQNLRSEKVQKEIHARLKRTMPETLYDTWAEDFVFLRLSGKKMVVGYTGNGSLRRFKKECKDAVWMHLCAALGPSRKLVIKKRRRKKTEE